jgi:hypothetical protein
MLNDLITILHGDCIALDKEEADALGGPAGDTISLWAAMQARHGSAFAHIVCIGLWLVQFRHCTDQLSGVHMRPQNYMRAAVCLVAFAPIVAVIWSIRKMVRCLKHS